MRLLRSRGFGSPDFLQPNEDDGARELIDPTPLRGDPSHPLSGNLSADCEFPAFVVTIIAYGGLHLEPAVGEGIHRNGFFK
jgi:hypothetical protein